MEKLRGIEVKLNLDLTQYHSGLVRGIEGNIVDPYYRDRFYLVKFPSIDHVCPIVNTSVDIIDKNYLADKENEYKTAKNIIYKVGPLGGFKYLMFDYIDSDGKEHSFHTLYRKEGLEVLEKLQKLGKEIKDSK